VHSGACRFSRHQVDLWTLPVASIGCDGAASIYGDREKGVFVYAGDGTGGAALAFSDTAFGAKLEGTGTAAKLWLTVSGFTDHAAMSFLLWSHTG
jgi:hypothetical protein